MIPAKASIKLSGLKVKCGLCGKSLTYSALASEDLVAYVALDKRGYPVTVFKSGHRVSFKHGCETCGSFPCVDIVCPGSKGKQATSAGASYEINWYNHMYPGLNLVLV
jgi:hypothetical protein